MDTQIIKIDTNLPFFEGFYGSDIVNFIDSEIEMFNEENDKEINFSKIYEEIAKIYVENFKQNLPSWVKSVKFNEIVSPRFYNFTNDIIYITVEYDVNGVLNFMENEKDSIQDTIKQYFTPYSGFSPSYSNDVYNFLNSMGDDPNDWDNIEMMVMLESSQEIQDNFDISSVDLELVQNEKLTEIILENL